MPLPDTHVCTACRTRFPWEKPRNGKAKVFGWVLIVLGVVAVPLAPLWVPGVIILVHAHLSGKAKCPTCKSKAIIPIESPRGQELAASAPVNP